MAKDERKIDTAIRNIAQKKEVAVSTLFKLFNKIGKKRDFKITRIQEEPFFRIDDYAERAMWLEFHKFRNGSKAFVLKFHKNLFRKGFISEGYFESEFLVDITIFGALMKVLNVLYKDEMGEDDIYLTVDVDGLFDKLQLLGLIV